MISFFYSSGFRETKKNEHTENVKWNETSIVEYPALVILNF